jgi:alcohol dehydrogenase, propanol-preferring
MTARDALPETMRAMVLERVGEPLVLRRRPLPALTEPGQVLLRVRACGVCRTDLHLVDGELPDPALPLIPGHQIVGEVVSTGNGVDRFQAGDRVGVPWLGYTDGTCRYCRRDQENLCPNARFTGYTIDGGYAEYALADARYCFPLPEAADLALAPLLCAGLIGFRTWRLAGGRVPERLGIYGFGAAAHIVTQIAVFHGQEVYAFTRAGDRAAQDFARRLGAVWAGGSDEAPPQVLDTAMIFAPVGALMVTALRHVDRGGTVVSGGHSHERHSVVPLPPAVGGAHADLGGQPDPGRWRGIPGTGRADPGTHGGAQLPAGAGKCCPARPARRAFHGGRGAGAVAVLLRAPPAPAQDVAASGGPCGRGGLTVGETDEFLHTLAGADLLPQSTVLRGRAQDPQPVFRGKLPVDEGVEHFFTERWFGHGAFP